MKVLLSLCAAGCMLAQGFSQKPWMNKSLSPDERADLVIKEMTLDEKIGLLHGQGMPHVPIWQTPLTNQANGGAGYVLGVPRLGIPALQLSDAAYGVRSSGENGRYSTALPSNLGAAASWDPHLLYEYGALIGRELRAQGYNTSLGGGVNLAREARNGRNFEYLGEDPVLAGTLVGNIAKGTQDQHVVGDIKHYAVNDQETGRNIVNAIISKRAMRESDLLAFEIGIKTGNPAAVMCSYNRVNGAYACENSYDLTDVLKHDWKFPGYVMSDWGGTHSTEKASHAGLDQEQPMGDFFGDKLKEAVQAGRVSQAELDDHVHRVLRSEFAAGIIDDPVKKSVVDVERGFDTAQAVEEQSIVLLRNQGNVLPLSSDVRTIAVIGGHADTGMLSGGGSAQVDAPGRGPSQWQEHIWFPTSPLKALRAALPNAKIEFDAGTDTSAAAALAKNADVAIVFAHQWESEGMDLPSLTLPDKQDSLIDAVAAANPKTVVVLETGGAVTMPWLDRVAGVVEAWYAGSRGHVALANVLTGKVNPSGKLAITFPRNEQDLPHKSIGAIPAEDKRYENNPPHDEALKAGLKYTVNYDEGLKVGYKWYDAENKPVLFPFGHGLSYTTFSYSNLAASPDGRSVTLTVTNTGKRAGAETAQLYAALPASAQEPPKRLVGWSKVMLNPGESKQITIDVPPHYLEIFDEQKNGWTRVPGSYTFSAGPSSRELPLKANVTLQ